MTADDLTAIARALAPVLRDHLALIQAKERGLDGQQGHPGIEGRPGRDGLPGSPGRDGIKGDRGLDGTNGREGTDGLGFDDLTIEHDGERGLMFRLTRGDRVKERLITIPAVIYRDVWVEGKTYDSGDMVTWGGSMWIAKEATTAKPGLTTEASRAWRLCVKAGRDGKAGPEGKSGPAGPRGEHGERGPERW